MYSLANNVLAQLKYDITGAALSLTVQPLAGVPPFNFPPAPTDVTAVPATYGTPYGILTLVDRLDPTAAKIEHIIYSARTAGVGADAGCYVYTVIAGGRGAEGSGAKAWTGGATYVLQQATQDVLALNTARATLMGHSNVSHLRDALDDCGTVPTSHSPSSACSASAGESLFLSDGFFEMPIPANGTTVKGFGGAADTAVAAGAIPIAQDSVLWYELPIGQADAGVAGNFHISTWTAAFVVPAHWIMIASNMHGAEKALRVCNGVTLYPWRLVGGAGEPTSRTRWVNFGAPFAQRGVSQGRSGRVYLRGVAKNGTAGLTIFTLPAGYRPASEIRYGVNSAGVFAALTVDQNGLVYQTVGGPGNAGVSLNIPPFQAEV
jgi:hypothetical protein